MYFSRVNRHIGPMYIETPYIYPYVWACLWASVYKLIIQDLIQWNLDERKPHHTKNLRYETGFEEEISVLFNEKIFKIRKRKSKVPHSKGKVSLFVRRCPWCNGYRLRKWTRRHEFKSWTRLIAFHIALIPLGKVWIQLFSFQLWINSRAD